MPQVMDGTPLRTSAAKRIHQLKRDEPYSERNTPPSTPTGTPKHGGLRQQNKCADDGIGHPAADFADGFWQLGEESPVDGTEAFLHQVIKHQHQRRDDQNRAHERDRLHQSVLELAPVVVGSGHLKNAVMEWSSVRQCSHAWFRHSNTPISISFSLLRFDARPGECFQKQLRQRVDQHGHAQQHQADFEQRAQIHVRRGLGEFDWR